RSFLPLPLFLYPYSGGADFPQTKAQLLQWGVEVGNASAACRDRASDLSLTCSHSETSSSLLSAVRQPRSPPESPSTRRNRVRAWSSPPSAIADAILVSELFW